MGIMDMFRNTPPANGATAKVANVDPGGNPPPAGGTPGAKDGQPASNADTSKAKNPLEVFSKMWENPSTEGKKAPPSFKLDPAAIKTASDSLDFSGSIPKDLMERLGKGDATALNDLANSIGRQAYANALEHSSALTDRFVEHRSQFDREGLGQVVTSKLSKNSLESVAANNPIVKSHLDNVSDMLLKHNPDANPEWIAERTKEYFLEIAKVIDPNLAKATVNGKPANQQQEETFDWGSWLDHTNTKQS